MSITNLKEQLKQNITNNYFKEQAKKQSKAVSEIIITFLNEQKKDFDFLTNILKEFKTLNNTELELIQNLFVMLNRHKTDTETFINQHLKIK